MLTDPIFLEVFFGITNIIDSLIFTGLRTTKDQRNKKLKNNHS